jgi:hypothetical protein
MVVDIGGIIKKKRWEGLINNATPKFQVCKKY